MVKLKDYTAQLTNAQYKKHLKHAQKYSRDKLASEDMLQEVFYRYLRYDYETDTPVAYVGMSIMNESRRFYRDGWHIRNSIEVDPDMLGSAVPIYNSDDYLVTEAINTLPAKQKKVLTMFLDDVKMKDIGTALNMPYDTVKANYRHAMLKVKEYLLQNNYEVQNGN